MSPRMLAIIPHPDDEAYSVAGTLALASASGWECLVVCATSGEAGERHDARGETPLGPLREAELAESCRILGAEPPRFWRFADGQLSRQPVALRELASDTIESLDPDVVLTLGADGAYGHPDHLALHRAIATVWQQAFPSVPALLFAAFPPGLFLPQYERCLPMLGDPPVPPPEALGAAPGHYTMDIRGVAAAKLAAVGAHRSQLPGGDPHALFPGGILAALLAEERFTDATGAPDPLVASLLRRLG